MSNPQTTPIQRLPISPVQRGKMTAYPGWRFIFDEFGVAHHVPDKELLDEMCKLYYKLPTEQDVGEFKQSGGIIG